MEWNNKQVLNDNGFQSNKVICLGDCSITPCPQNHTLFELDIITGYYPGDFSWQLMNSNNDVLANRNNYEEQNKYYYYRECVPVTNNECAMLRLIDSYGDGGTFYIVSWDGNVIEEGKQGNNNNHEITMGNCR